MRARYVGSLLLISTTTTDQERTSNGEKTRPGYCPEQQLFARCPSMINEAREVFCQGRFPASLIYVLTVNHRPLSRRLLCSLPLVILQQAAKSFPALHCSHVPSCFRLRRKQYAISLPLMVPLFMVMQQILLQGSPQRRLSNQDDLCQAFLFD